jgi:IS5 family transposase
MGYKKTDRNMTFAEVDLKGSMEHNRSLKMMERINETIDWSKIEPILMKHYPIGASSEGADAYPPMMLLKAFLLQKWFRINSDPELENQINDRISFKKFLGISFDQPSPDHSTFCRFRSRLSKNTMTEINNALLVQFSQKGLTINQGIAIDARLVQSASRPLSNEEIKKRREKKETPEGKLDKNGKPLKFSRDLESDWTVKNNEPHYGQKEHTSVDVNHGFVLATEITPASVHDSQYLPYCVAASRHTEEPIGKVYTDKGYFGKPNREFLALNKIADGIMRKDTRSTTLTPYEKERNKQIAKKRYIVEQYFGLSHLHNGAFRARFTRIIKNLIEVMCRQLAFNITRGVKILSTT